MRVQFFLNGEAVTAEPESPTQTLLDWLREKRRLTGTKEGCNEGDCGACTVMVTDSNGSRAVNACILFLPQIAGKAVRTVEGLAGPDGTLHPVQQALIDHHGSQCGFCTPGFAVAMAVAHKNGAKDHDDQLAGNLCRCTGYAPIVRAAEAAAEAPVPAWLAEDDARAAEKKDPPFESRAEDVAFRPATAGDLASWYARHPEAVLVAGATDVGLWATKQLRQFGPVAYISHLPELQQIEVGEDEIRVGACVTIEALRQAIAPLHPSFAEMLRRFGSMQVRNSGTVGGNIANGSPIGDSPPALIALGARLHLRQGNARRDMPLEDFFIAYGKQDRSPGEFVEFITIPRQPDRLRCYKLSKRFDQDISAVCGCFSIVVEEGRVTSACIAFGGMAATPKRASAVECRLSGQPWTAEMVAGAVAAFAEDFTPLSDMRASAEYRLKAAQNMLWRYWHADQGALVDALEVHP